MTHSIARQPVVIHVRLNQLNRRCPWEVTATLSDGQVQTLASFRYALSEPAAHETLASFQAMLGGRTLDEARSKAQEQARGLEELRGWLLRRIERLTQRMERGEQWRNGYGA